MKIAFRFAYKTNHFDLKITKILFILFVNFNLKKWKFTFTMNYCQI